LNNSSAEQHHDPAGAAVGGLDQYARRVMSGRERGARAALLRAAMAAVEPFYGAVTAGRNRLFDVGILRSHRLPRPVVSVGNITTGGTGKTPVVRWLAERLRERGRRVAILSRGYGATPGQLGDEQLMLQRLLNTDDAHARVTLVANPDRTAAARRILHERPDIDVFLLDDAFQHRRVQRDFDLVLINATSPFGYGRVLPRGMLREPLRGLRRANAVIITHADHAAAADLDAIERQIRIWNVAAPVYHAAQVHAGIRHGADATLHPLGDLRDRNWFAFCAIGDPDTFFRQLQSVGGRAAGRRRFADHHHYTPQDLAALRREAAAAGADVLVTTEKDWAKLEQIPSVNDEHPPVWHVDVRIQFFGSGEALLLEQLSGVLKNRAG
jgi:tetraacyldisaccharide 4'-kinase